MARLHSARPSAYALATHSLCLGLALTAAHAAMAQQQASTAGTASTSTTRAVVYDIPAGALGSALLQFAARSGVTLSFDPTLTESRSTEGLKGSYTLGAGFAQLLAGSGLEQVPREGGGYTLRKATAVAAHAAAPDAAGSYTMREVRVTGKRDGETEGSGSYTTEAVTIGKTAQALRELPQSVSVVTRQRLDDQNLTDLGQAAGKATGITVQDQGFRLTNLYSRGFAINSFQLDGGAPMDKGFVANVEFDMAQFDRVEVMRGPAGLLNGTGNPGGAVNLVRKMPTATPQFGFTASAGSWDNYRTEFDASGPLLFDGKLRGRAVLAYENRQYFIDRRASEKPLFYGVLEADIGPSAVLVLGAREHRFKEKGNSTDVPRYTNGADLGLARNTGLSADWSRLDGDSKEIFAKLTWRLANRWTLRANAAQTRQSGSAYFGSMSGAIDPLTREGARWNAARNLYSNQQDLLDVNLSGAFDLLGRTHELLVGADVQDITSRWQGGYPTGANNIPANVFDRTTTPFPHPNFGEIVNEYDPWAQKQYGAYGTLRMEVADRTKVIVGARANKYRYSQAYWEKFDASGASTDTMRLSDATRYSESTKITPFAGVVHDVNAQWTAYASYAQIFNPQYSFKAGPAPGTGLDPVRGSNAELGVKGELLDGKLHTAFALYHTVQDNRAVQDSRYPWSSVIYAGSCCYLASGKVVSQGLDMEVGGDITRGVKLSAGYTYNNNKDKTENATFSTITPKHLLKFWGTWQLPEAASAWRLGVGATIQSKQYVSGTAATYNPASGRYDGVSVPFRYTQGGYAIWNTMVEYRIDPQWTLALTLNNVFDKFYYRTVGSSWGGNYYGEPRSAALTLRGRF